MRIHLTIFILTTFFVQISTASLAQRISLNKTNVPLQQIFKEIGKQSGYDFVYSTELMKQAKNVTVNVSKATLRETLDVCFDRQPLDYEIDDNSIIIKEKPVVSKAMIVHQSTQIIITGWVTDEKINLFPV